MASVVKYCKQIFSLKKSMSNKLVAISFHRPSKATFLAYSIAIFICSNAVVGIFYLYYPDAFNLSTNFTGFNLSHMSFEVAFPFFLYFIMLSLLYCFVSLAAQNSFRISRNYPSRDRQISNILQTRELVSVAKTTKLVISFEKLPPLIKIFYWGFTLFLIFFIYFKYKTFEFSFNDRQLKFAAYILLPTFYGLSVGFYLRKARNILSALVSIVPICVAFPFISLLEVTRDYIPGLFLAFSISFSVKQRFIRNLSGFLLLISSILALVFSFITRIAELSEIDPFLFIFDVDTVLFGSALIDSLFYVTGFSFLNIVQQSSIAFSSFHSWSDLFWNLQPINPSLFGIYSPLQSPLFDPVRPYSAFSHFYSLSPVLPLIFIALLAFISTRVIIKIKHPLVFIIIISLNLLFILSFFQYYPRQCIRFLQLIFAFYFFSFLRLPSFSIK